MSLALPLLKSFIISTISSGSVSRRKIVFWTDLDIYSSKVLIGTIGKQLSTRISWFSFCARDAKYSLNLFAIILLHITLCPSITKLALIVGLDLPRISFISCHVFLGLLTHS